MTKPITDLEGRLDAAFARSEAARFLRAIPSKERSETSRLNGKKGGRHKKNCTCTKHAST